ncbi:prolow-density lipoprotein receptor-related protein 1-like isoform X3 [Mizuhopecten yessoensis]|uniref:prolow-density lipoprotein receptor-related protein 1-like isoform X3 n=1 Tax=Mizuhopecten yessoensis TaxID=6573 RepID=UPI000B4593E3|nr:prolow-density lipoprotein receptor-related protein 1-like isoform X3 [Mizuhopecten yessoensis]
MRRMIGGSRPIGTKLLYFLAVFGLLALSPSAQGCNSEQFQCDDGTCIEKSWRCDGSPDCMDESDEANCPVSTRKKRFSTEGAGISPDSLLPCLPNYKRCPDEEVCIPIYKFCDNERDCKSNGDEEGCSDSVANCDSKNCTFACRNTPQGPECYCPDGKQPNGTECINIDPCSYPLYCDQQCRSKTSGSFSCGCAKGYDFVDGKVCIAINVPSNLEPTLLVADFMRFQQVALSGKSLTPPVVAAGQAITTLDFNHRKQFACWLSYRLDQKISVMECLNLTNTAQTWIMKSDVSFDNVVQIAFDWITENWYVADRLKERIVLCNATMNLCRMVLELPEQEIFSIRVDPTAGYLFVLTKSSIIRTQMDGSDPQVIHQGSKADMERPQDMTLDFPNRHLYWTDIKLKGIKRMDYDGQNVWIVFSRLRPTIYGNVIKGLGISLLQNTLYMTSSESLWAVHRYNYNQGPHLLTRDLEYPSQVHVYHRVRQPDLPDSQTSPCTPSTCDHLCVVLMNGTIPTARCLCAAGYDMNENNTCIVNETCPTDPNCQGIVCSWPVQCNISTPCMSGYMRCPKGSCVPESWWCDGDDDCNHAQDPKMDMADEKFCGQRTCSVEEFRCKDGTCMPREFQCDGYPQCEDNSDEHGCHNPLPAVCDNDKFRCSNGSCLAMALLCNNVSDCPDGSDEMHCEECEPGSFRCMNGECIPGAGRCDGKSDCQDKSDETLQCSNGANATYHQCKNASNQFNCGAISGEKRCIPSSWKCDNEYDCQDKSDEMNCTGKCEAPHFMCKNNQTCLPFEKICNGIPDCTDQSDEENCKSCDVWGVCSQVCTPLPLNKHNCSCLHGYQIKSDGYSCKPIGGEPVYIIFSNQHQMRRVELTNYTYASLVSGLKNTIALDFYYAGNAIFWTDVVDDKIFRGTMLGNSTFGLTNIEPIIDVGLATTEGLAIDWIGQNIYWVESNLDQIEVAKLDGSYRTTFIAGGMVSPRAIVLDPRKGSLFWTDWDSDNPRIETCSMSGQERKVIFNIQSIMGAGWPNGLTIDYDFNRLYWIDARSDSIHTIKYDGSDHRLILKGHEKMRHPFALTLFGNYVYWTDWSSSALLRANKFNGSDVTVIQKTVSQPFDLQVYHPMRQPMVKNPCGDNNGNCSHLCLIGYNQTASCMCPHLYKLAKDNHTCENDHTFLLFVKTSEIRGVDLLDANYNVIPTITIPNVDKPTAIDYDLEAERLYWSDSSLNLINSAYINGSGVETIIDSGISSPQGFAIDWLSKNMYFSSLPSGGQDQKASISVAKLNGAFRVEIPLDIIGNNPRSLAVLPTEGLLFWADQTLGTGSFIICRSKMDGSDSRIISQPQHPVNLQVDPGAQKRLYWIELGGKVVHMSDIDGRNEKQLTNSKLQRLQAFTIHKDNTFYVAQTTGEIGMFTITNETELGIKYRELRDKTQGVTALKVFDNTSRSEGTNGCSNNTCAQLCLPTGKKTHICKCTAGYHINGTKCTSIDSFLMYSSSSEIHGISFNLTNNVTKALPLISKISKASSIDFNAAADHIYWVDAQSNYVSRVKRDLTERDTIVHQEIRGIQGIAVDWISDNVYWTDFGSDVIEVVRLSNVDHRFVVIHGNMNNPRTIVVHPVAGLLFWTDTGIQPKIEQARLDGTKRKVLVDTNVTAPYGLAIDYVTNVLYWCDNSLNKIEAIHITTGNRKLLLDHDVDSCVALTLFEDHVYWLEGDVIGKIKRANKTDGSNVEEVKTNLGPDMQDIKAYDTQRQQGVNPCSVDNGGCQEFCFHVGNSVVSCNCSYGKVGSDGKTCEGHDSFLLFSKVTHIVSISLDEHNPNLPMKMITNSDHLRNVIGLATDYKSKRIFFSDIQRGDIQYVHFNSSDFYIVVEGVGSVEGLAYEGFSNYLYWTSYTNSSISRAHISEKDDPLHNTTVEKIIQLGVFDHPRAIAVDSCSDRLFWTNWHDEQPKIQRAFLNGYMPESIITEEIWTPNGLTIDHVEQQLYWSDARLDKIEHCDFDGKNRKVVVSAMPEHPFSLAVYGQYIYWTDWIRRAVMRSNKYDGGNVFWMKRDLERQPMGITVVAEDANNCTMSRCYNHKCENNCSVINGHAQCVCGKDLFLLPDGHRCGPANTSCGITDFVCHDKKACISIEKRCNKFNDCFDASDEHTDVCTNKTCAPGLFTCSNFMCVHIEKFCDGKVDCSDGSDEANCTCQGDQFQCQSGLCIQRQYRCDRDMDCPDWDDEVGCNMTCKNLEMFEYEGGVVSCNTTSQCILLSWICDGNRDCWDGNDENYCDNSTKDGACDDDGFKCKSSGACIPHQWECDNDNDCGDNSDEKQCNYTCESHMFQCNESKMCLPRSWECDGHPDCANHSDEGSHCKTTNRTCQESEYLCEGTGRCIPKQWKCDGDIDCPNGEDERIENGCPPAHCKRDEFMCKNRRCIRNIFVCDRDDDCGDNSDEPVSCVFHACKQDQFPCKQNGTCISKNLTCNGFPDCPDHSDEANCTVAPPCGSEMSFKCDNSNCIHINDVCDGKDDCGDLSDEAENCHINECSPHQFMCSQNCTDLKIGYQCSCYAGYKLRSDGKTCQDINECQSLYPCSHFCTNMPGSYFCRCADGYLLAEDRHSCKVHGAEQPFLIVANRYYLRRVSLSGIEEKITENLNNAVAIGFSYQDEMVYWTDITSKSSSINRMKIINGTKEVIHSSTVRNPDGLAVDWVGKNLYWCDKTTDTIEVSKLDGKYRKVLIREGLEEPRALEVFPAKGFMFYTDWGEKPHISRSYLDGSDTQKIITQDLAWPNALTIDYVTEKIFWADASLDYIAMANLDGTARHMIIDRELPHTFALTTFMNYIYWTDWEKGSIERAEKFTGKNRSTVAVVIHRLMDIQVYHKMRQVEMHPNPCENNGGCSHLCLLRPVPKPMAYLWLNSVERVCACPENHDLLPDGVNCVSNCTSAQFLCTASSKCIPFWWKCDGQQDCEDGSDEPSTCTPYRCSRPGLFRCKNSPTECIPPVDICDGKPQCSDASDEQECDKFHCLAGFRKCPDDDVCVEESKFCNGILDCPSKIDEQNCTYSQCEANQFQCSNKRCVPYVWRCDSDNDCGDGSDEPADCRNMTCMEGYVKCDTGRCIPSDWQCDGDVDCGPEDHSDEDNTRCRETTCDPTYFQCDNKHCIPSRWKCDFDNDCRDGSDEKNCSHRQCSQQEFKCNNNKCIPQSWKCNGEMNCEDGSDEEGCSGLDCNKDEFKCAGICVPNKWMCDEDIDCPDGSDERNCSSSCLEGKFLCENKECIPELWQCDGDNDCGDNSDEITNMCMNHQCPLGRFRCKNHLCLAKSKHCDGIDQCGDKSDEENCYYDTICHGRSYRCAKNDRCIPIHQVCDGQYNCLDHSDEKSDFCKPENIKPTCGRNACQQTCVNITGVGYKCSCKRGYKLTDDGFSCKAVDLCKLWGTCSQSCKLDPNNPTTNCSCDDGYTMWTDNVSHRPTCHAEGPKPQLLIAHERELIQSDIGFGGQKQSLMTSEMDKILSIDVDMTHSLLTSSTQWTAFIISHDKTLKKMTIDAQWAGINIPNKKTKPGNTRTRRSSLDLKAQLPVKFVDLVADPQGIAVDWVAKRIYWTDAGTRTVEMTDYDGVRKITVVSSGLDQPYSIAVAPEAGKLFWTDRGFPPKIETSNLDGSGRKDLVKDDIVWPNGLAIDQANHRLYWTDTKKHTIETIGLNGDDRQVVWQFEGTEDPPFMLDVFEDYLYVTLYRSHSIIRMHKFGRKFMNWTDVLLTNITFIGDIIILQPIKQKNSIVNYCHSNNTHDGPCSGAFCVNMPQQIALEAQAPKFKCLCPNDAVFEDGKCSFRKSCEPGYCKNGGSCHPQLNGNSKCSCPAGVTGDRCEKCDESYCQNGGQCIVTGSTFSCNCKGGFTGPRCGTDVCIGYCDNNGHCSYLPNGNPKCVCRHGFTGATCQSCTDDSCTNGGTCQIVGGSVSCLCPEGFSGNKCETGTNSCQDYCKNGGTCDPNSNAVDVKNTERYICTCTSDWSGQRCEQPAHGCAGYCQNGGDCNIVQGEPNCNCTGIYEGDTCETCQCQQGSCEKLDNGKAVCVCNKKWKGVLCAESICDTDCFHGGQCQDCYLGDDHVAACNSCLCTAGFHGDHCEKGLEKQAQADSVLIPILIPIIAIFLILILIVIALVVRKKRDQFKHRRMMNNSNLEVANPIYLAQSQEGDEHDDRDMSPMQVYDEDGDDSTNFANPMYNRLYTSDSTQVLLPRDMDNNEPFDENGDIHFYGNKKDKTNGKIAYA